MDPRERWQTLQTRLASARALAEAGDRAAALQEVDHALALDPDFLAAHSLKERLAAIADLPREVPESARAMNDFESRARARRADRRLAAAIDAIDRRDFDVAAAAIDEARELGVETERLLRIERALVEAQLSRKRRALRGPSVAAVATLMFGVLGATYLGERNGTEGPRRAAAATAAPAPAEAADSGSPATLDGEVSPVQPLTEIVKLPPRAPRPEAPVRQAAVQTVLSASMRQPDTAPSGSLIVPSAASTAGSIPDAVPAVSMPAASNVVAPVATTEAPPARLEPAPLNRVEPAAASAARSDSTVALAVPTAQLVAPQRPIEDDAGVRDVLQRYRAAYDQLSARSARAVWPAVDERALAQAFNGLASQRLVFDACDVNMRGDKATAVCRGTAQYVPKVGSADPQVEPRTWKFTLKKAQTGWAIDTARADR